MNLELRHRLPFVSVLLDHQGGTVELKPVLIDTGSASTVLSADVVEAVGITPQPDDVINKLRGIGGTEVVYMRVVDRLSLGEASVSNFEVEIGGMDYGFEIQGILGMDFLRQTEAVINLKDLTVEFG